VGRVGKIVPRRSLSAQDDIAVDTTISDCHISRAKRYSMHKAKNAMETLIPTLPKPDYFPVVWDA
jgi:hypothetical protein